MKERAVLSRGHRTQSEPAAEEVLHATLPRTAIPIHRIRLEWASMQGVVEQLEKLELLGAQFLYSAFEPGKLPQVLEHGTYIQAKGKRIPNLVFCCELRCDGEEKSIVQVGNRDLDLWEYLTQNSDPDQAALIVFDRDKLQHRAAAEFAFKDSARGSEAVCAIVIFDNFGG